MQSKDLVESGKVKVISVNSLKLLLQCGEEVLRVEATRKKIITSQTAKSVIVSSKCALLFAPHNDGRENTVIARSVASWQSIKRLPLEGKLSRSD